MQLLCPHCQSELNRSGESKRHCETCHSDFILNIECNECGAILQRLKACGAVNFWCEDCNELKSKSSANYKLVANKSST
ncbi:zinc ribbon domain-containing protein [Psychromonas arctica]|uniref:zinc ribbon domain-containing protein n=1 Tax=Psychromonas arctica TaxID=168275 RepID=UPI002FD774EC